MDSIIIVMKEKNIVESILLEEKKAKIANVIQPYEFLYNESRDARYKCKTFFD